MSPALLKIAKRRRRAKDKEMIEAKWRQKDSKDSSVDRISMLPDDVLALILSHFTLKEHMTFSILSRRWRHLWTLTTSFDFDGMTMDSLERRRKEKGTSPGRGKLNFVSWVNRVLASCQSPTIEDFRLRFILSKNDGGHINEWLRYALAKKVKTLVLKLNFNDYWPRREVLDECYVFPYRSLHIDEAIHFKHLEKLSLDYVSLDDEALKFFLHSCPLLEELSVSNTSKLSNLSLVGPFPSLKRLAFSLCCLKLLEIRDVNLVYLEYSGGYTELRLHNLPKLVNLSVPFPIFAQMIDVVQFESILQQLEALYIYAVWEKFSFPVKMNNLKQLGITCRFSRHYKSHKWLADLIRSVPSLQKIVFKVKATSDYPRFRERELERTKIEGSYLELEEVEFWGFVGTPIDLEFVWHLVDNAAGLKRVVIDARELINGRMSCKEYYKAEEINAMDRAEKQLALQVPSKIKLDFLRPRALGL